MPHRELVLAQLQAVDEADEAAVPCLESVGHVRAVAEHLKLVAKARRRVHAHEGIPAAHLVRTARQDRDVDLVGLRHGGRQSEQGEGGGEDASRGHGRTLNRHAGPTQIGYPASGREPRTW